MSGEADMERAVTAVQQAFERLRTSLSAENWAACDRAFAQWEDLARTTSRGPGRPQRGDQSLTSAERARTTRERQNQLASRWMKVAPLVQQMRRAVDAGDTQAIMQTARALTEETAMKLHDFQVIHAQPDPYCAVVQAWDGHDMVLAFISREALSDHFHRIGLRGADLSLLVDRNIKEFGRIISDKFERGDHRPYSRAGSTLRRVDITLDDIKASGEELTDSVLDVAWSWQRV